MLRLWEVVSVVDQFSNMSKVNTLCITQVCKCFHYNTGFFLVTYRACLLPESRLRPHSVEPSGWLTPPLSTRASEGDDNTKVLHTGGWVCILWVSEQWRKQQRHVIQTLLPSHPRFPYTSCGISKQRGGTLLKALGRLKMHLISTISARVPETLVRTWCIHAFVYTFWWL